MTPDETALVARLTASIVAELLRQGLLAVPPREQQRRPVTPQPREPAKPLTATDLSSTVDDPRQRIVIKPAEGLPPLVPLVLSQQEAEILEAVSAERGRLQGPEIGRAVRHKYDAALRRLLSRMRSKTRLLDWSGGEGYGITRLGLGSLEAWRLNQIPEEADD